jgi:hypothetical protein
MAPQNRVILKVRIKLKFCMYPVVYCNVRGRRCVNAPFPVFSTGWSVASTTLRTLHPEGRTSVTDCTNPAPHHVMSHSCKETFWFLGGTSSGHIPQKRQATSREKTAYLTFFLILTSQSICNLYTCLYIHQMVWLSWREGERSIALPYDGCREKKTL